MNGWAVLGLLGAAVLWLLLWVVFEAGRLAGMLEIVFVRCR